MNIRSITAPVIQDRDALEEFADALTDRWHNPGDTDAQTARAVCAHTKLEIALMRPDEPCGGVRTDGWIEWHGGERPVPEGTKLVLLNCPDCHRGDFDEPAFFDAAGREIVWKG